MQIQSSYIVNYEGKIQILYATDYGYFISSNGAFGQRETYLEKISPDEARELINKNDPQNKK